MTYNGCIVDLSYNYRDILYHKLLAKKNNIYCKKKLKIFAHLFFNLYDLKIRF